MKNPENKTKPPVSGQDNKNSELLKAKINGWLISYFNYLTLALSLVIFAVGLFFLVYPQYQQIAKDSQAAQAAMQKDYEDKYNYLSAIRNLKKAYQQVAAEDKSKIDAMVPPQNDLSDIIPEIESIVLKNGAVLNSIKLKNDDVPNQPRLKAEPGNKSEPPAGIFSQLPQGVGRINIEIEMASVNYPVLKNIIKTLENNLRLLDVAKITYAVKETKVILNIYAYYLPR